jgi:predicted nucleic acid binding AN1-type Zn finger protein
MSYDFRLNIIKNLLPEKPVEYSPTVLTHFVSHCSPSAKGKTLRKRCKNCYQKGLRKDTICECKVCKAGFCLEPCFEEFHRNLTS